jgi:hypothetical protein
MASNRLCEIFLAMPGIAWEDGRIRDMSGLPFKYIRPFLAIAMGLEHIQPTSLLRDVVKT